MFEIIHNEERKKIITAYIDGQISMSMLSQELGETKSGLYFKFKKEGLSNPVEQRKVNLSKIYKKCGMCIEKGESIDQLIKEYPTLLNKEKIRRLVKRGVIKCEKPILTLRQIERENLKNKVIYSFEKGDSISHILNHFKIKRSLFISFLRSQYGVTSIREARKKADENKVKQTI